MGVIAIQMSILSLSGENSIGRFVLTLCGEFVAWFFTLPQNSGSGMVFFYSVGGMSLVEDVFVRSSCTQNGPNPGAALGCGPVDI